jgi:site-specific recombinase XerD
MTQPVNELFEEWLRCSQLAAASKDLKMRAGIKTPKRFHDLRGSYCLALLEGGVDLAKVQDLMRHASGKTTIDYCRKYERTKLVAQSRLITQKSYETNVS